LVFIPKISVDAVNAGAAEGCDLLIFHPHPAINDRIGCETPPFSALELSEQGLTTPVPSRQLAF
jgi:hypothetical protein